MKLMHNSSSLTRSKFSQYSVLKCAQHVSILFVGILVLQPYILRQYVILSSCVLQVYIFIELTWTLRKIWEYIVHCYPSEFCFLSWCSYHWCHLLYCPNTSNLGKPWYWPLCYSISEIQLISLLNLQLKNYNT